MGFFSGESETTSEVTPWGPAAGVLKDHLGMIRGQPKWTTYGGQELADFNTDQLLQQQGVRDYLARVGDPAAQQMMSAGQDMLGGFGQAQDFYGQAMNQQAVQNTGPDMGIAARAAYNPFLSDQIQQAAGDVTTALYENQMPGIAAYAGGTGNLGSSRRGLLEAAATRDAGNRIASIASGMRGNAWNQGMGYANQIAQQNAQLNQQNQQMQMNAANQMGSMGQMGGNMMQNAQNFWGQQNQMLGGVGQAGFDQAQRGYDLASQRHYMGQQLPYQQAGMGVGIGMGPAQAFSTQTNTQENGGMFGALMGPAMSLGSAYLGAGGLQGGGQ